MTGAFSAAAFSAAFYIGSAPPIEAPILGGANPWGEKAKQSRGITEERIRKAKDREIENIIKSLRDDGILPPEVIEEAPDYSIVRRLYAEQLAQIARQAAKEFERRKQEEEFILLMMLS